MVAERSEPSLPEPPRPGQVVVRHADVLLSLGRFDEAAELARAWLRGAPHDLDLRVVLGHAYREKGLTAEAADEFRTVLSADPDHVAAGAGLALALFAQRDWGNAFAAYDVRFRLMDTPPRVTRKARDGSLVEVPRWLGGPVPKALLVLAEQGLGDTIQFARYLPALARTGAKITAVVQPRLIALLKPLCPGIEWRSLEERGSVTAGTGWLTLMDIPRALGLTEAELAAPDVRLVPDPDLVARMAARLGPAGFRIGVCWQGNPDKRIDNGRSMPVAELGSLAALPGVRLVALQHGPAAATLKDQPFAAHVLDLGSSLDQGADGFLETAAAIAGLDLVVTVDTALAHLAASMGKPVFLCLKLPGADWRWSMDRQSSVWYPSVRLFRQTTPGDWSRVMADVAVAVMALKGAAAPPPREVVAGPRLIPSVLGVGAFFARLADVAARLEVAGDPAEKAALTVEKRGLQGAWARLGLDARDLKPMISALTDLARRLIEAEARLTALEQTGDHGPDFVTAARAVILLTRERDGLTAEIDRTGTLKQLGTDAFDAVA